MTATAKMLRWLWLILTGLGIIGAALEAKDGISADHLNWSNIAYAIGYLVLAACWFELFRHSYHQRPLGDSPVIFPTPEATERGRELLLRLLTPAQRRRLRDNGPIVVNTALACYFLTPHQRVMVMAHRNSIEYSICVNTTMELICGCWHLVPEEDRLIALLMMIRTDEEGFWRRFAPGCSIGQRDLACASLETGNRIL